VIIDAPAPQTLSFEQLVLELRCATGSRAPIPHLRPIAMAAAALAVGRLLGDVVLTADEVEGLTAGLLVCHHPPLGRPHSPTGCTTTQPRSDTPTPTELQRHFNPVPAA
jgi:NADH dehydrogenase